MKGGIRDVATAVYIVTIAVVAQMTDLSFILSPELGALSHDILKRPHGTWARAPLMLVITPLLTGVIGTLVTQHLAYGLASVLLTVGSSVLIIKLLHSPIAPAISAGLLPLTLGEPTWWYPPCLLVGLVPLAALSVLARRFVPRVLAPPLVTDRADDAVEEAPDDYSWIPFFVVFLVVGVVLVALTGRRFLLSPPLVVIAFEMFAHADICPWAGHPFMLPVACTLCAAAGVTLVGALGAGPLAAVLSVASSISILRAFDLHVPPALAVGLLPSVIPSPNYGFPLAVAAGALLLTTLFLTWRKLLQRSR